MGSANQRTILSEQIAEILGARERTVDAGDRAATRLSVRKSIACGSMMLLAINPGQVGAVGLGDIHLKSRLGQPLEATVPVILHEGESLPKNCVRPAPANNTLGSPRDMQVMAPARSGPGTYNVRITTANALHEPMYELSLMVKCQGSALLVRHYVLMLDLPGMPVTETTPMTIPARTELATPRTNTARDDAPAARRVPADPARALPPRADSIPAGGTYRVSSGDTLSTIARRVEGRLRDTTWQVADQIFADNPDAFIRNDPNMIKLGSLIRVPEVNILAAMAPGAARSRVSVSTESQATANVTDVPESATLPAPAPVAVSRNDVATARRTPNTVADLAGSRETDATSVGAAEPAVAATEPTAETAPDYTSSFSPFADEQPAETVVSAPELMEDITTPPVATAAAESAESGQSSSLLAILVGLLLGAALGLLFLRGRLLEALGMRRPQRKPVAVQVARERTAASPTDTFNQDLAAAAFDRTRENSDEMTSLPFSGPAEDTYIVETAPAEPTIQENTGDLHAAVSGSETVEQPSPAQHADTEDDDDSAELAKLFDNDDVAGVGEPTAEMPRQVPDSLDPTAEIPVPEQTVLEPTAQMPQHADEEIFDPTAELPADAMDDIFDPTGGLDDGNVGEIESTLMQAFDEGLENEDPNEMFATANHAVDEITGDTGVRELDVTINDPLADPLLDEATVAADLSELPLGRDGGDDLSETLQEALNLLERDYEDEFTASQIIERSTLEKSLQEERDKAELDRTDDNIKRKIS